MIHLETEKSAEPKGKTEISRDFFVPHLSISRFAVAESPASSLFARAESIIYTSERQFETSVSGSDGEASSFSWIRRDEQQVPQHSVHCPMKVVPKSLPAKRDSILGGGLENIAQLHILFHCSSVTSSGDLTPSEVAAFIRSTASSSDDFFAAACISL